LRRIIRVDPAQRRRLALEKVAQRGAFGASLTVHRWFLGSGVDDLHGGASPLPASSAHQHLLGLLYRQASGIVAPWPTGALAPAFNPTLDDGEVSSGVKNNGAPFAADTPLAYGLGGGH
jgi:hypothetical protein